jgi:UDP-N-acetylmuramyl tripeptide synthase
MKAPVDLLAVCTGKLTLLALRLMGRRGNALPGLVVEKLFRGYLPRAMAGLPQGVVVVTGTNGKTTTTKMVATILAQRFRVLTNDTGSNFVRGAITATVQRASWAGGLPYDVAVFELDEAWAVRFVELVPPRRALLLNVMRDQLDRFGEIDTTARLLGKVAAATTGHVVLNRDDERVAALGDAAAANRPAADPERTANEIPSRVQGSSSPAASPASSTRPLPTGESAVRHLVRCPESSSTGAPASPRASRYRDR